MLEGDTEQFVLESTSTEDTINYGRLIALSCSHSVMILLHGDLGAGKTTFVRGLAEGLGVKLGVSSPTFNLLNVYKGTKFSVYHIDAYREKTLTWDSLMLDDIMEEPFCCVIEWPENFLHIPDEYVTLRISIRIAAAGRLISISLSDEKFLNSINFAISR